ncbi:Ecotropic viral integration site 5 -like protein [Babesia sp. Xinjiang]|uniref:Ecotropic viral integration site 5 -like protein n=1 Tax=Babesia sp. Xinjiang TaxID=462227 RepID=UPI000A226355|nr:Ecotropic viral integration site 5 -like protein [Babesia sp. Xinjiang]ORM41373.1 Ecotropic viral integration site 5 -like protein [Babesia sp. Xinjiang]
MKVLWRTDKRKDIVTCYMTAITDVACANTQNKKVKINKRILGRISDYERGTLWKIWAKTEQYKNQFPNDMYGHLLSYDNCEFDVAIKKDLNRTFPEHAIFKDGAYAQKILFNVLHAYAMYNPDVGYCQGMAFIAGMLVLYMNEEDAFFTMISIMDKHNIKTLFLPQMRQLERYCDVLDQYLRRKMKKLYAHMQQHGVDITIVAAKWFMTLFTYNFSIETAALLWDAILSMDDDWVLSIAIAIFKLMEVCLHGYKKNIYHAERFNQRKPR